MIILNNTKTIKIKKMKTLYFYMLIGFLTIVSCNTNEKPNSEKIYFGIYETVLQKALSQSMLDEFKQTNIELNVDTLSSIIGYVKVDSTKFLSKIENEKVKLLTTAQPIDKEKMYFAIVAVKKQSIINNSDIKKTKPNQNNVEIYFDLEGANKWANLTKNNIGKLIAFTIDNEIYTLTSVNGEIKNGTAILNGLENGDMAIKISKSINSSL
jgi:preprotein translocase subunit SecD